MGFIRLDKLLSNAGYGSRKEIKQLLRLDIVTVDGEVVRLPELKIDADKQKVLFNGESVFAESLHYYMMNKPAGVISATYDEEEDTVIDLLDDEAAAQMPFPVGRLDKDTVGLLILTNDGAFAHRVLSPKKHVPKTYRAIVTGALDDTDVAAFAKGITLEDEYTCKPAILRILSADSKSEAEVVITEGKYHQVKRMFAARGKTVVYLQRTAFGSLTLDDSLEEGEYRKMTTDELALVMN